MSELTRREWLRLSGVTATSAFGTSTVAGRMSNEATATTSTADWQSFHNGPTNTGHARNTTGPGSGASPTKEYHTAGGYEAPPIIADGIIYAANRYGDLLAVDTTDGTRNWKFATGEQILASPTLRDGTIYVGGTNEKLYAIDATDGSEEWTYRTDGQDVSAPTVAGGSVFFGSYDRNVYSVDAVDGTENWRFETSGVLTTRSRISNAPAVADGTVYVGNLDRRLYALDAADGSKRWEVAKSGYVWAPAVVDDTVYAGTSGGKIYAFDASSGKQRWSFGGPQRMTAPAVADGTVYVGRYEGAHQGEYDVRLYALDAADGSELWQFTTDGKIVHSPVVADGRVYVSIDDPPKLQVVDAASGTELDEYPAGESTEFGSLEQFTAPIVSEGTLYVGSEDGNLWAVGDRASSGSPPTPAFDRSPKSPEVDQSVTFDASASSDPDGTIATYEWDFDGDGSFEVRGETTSHTFESTGEYAVTLRVTDGTGRSATTETMVTVSKSPFQQVKESHLSKAEELDAAALTDMDAVEQARTANDEYTTAVENGDISEETAIDALQRIISGLDTTLTTIRNIGGRPEFTGDDQYDLTQQMAVPTINTGIDLALGAFTILKKLSDGASFFTTSVLKTAKSQVDDAIKSLTSGMFGNAVDAIGMIRGSAPTIVQEILKGVAQAEVVSMVEEKVSAIADTVADGLQTYAEQDMLSLLPGVTQPFVDEPAALDAGVGFLYDFLSAERLREDGLAGSTNVALQEARNAQSSIETEVKDTDSVIQDAKEWSQDHSLVGSIIEFVRAPSLEDVLDSVIGAILTLTGGVANAFATGAGFGALIKINVTHHIGLVENIRGEPL
ncbi:outer membrane protein assembly factor BamB family protein [Halorussus salinus]|uniref:outer membrane protein assembly factor BamB family protein n=1 Tax=Halorussus salinus TaxID=1364935 RepID=UPI00138F6009|nr:PQQ-binding-like beta-propeller repeat protein [Halorussus salinus]